MSRFGSDPFSFFNSVYQNIPPWDIGTAQPAMAALVAKYPPTDPVLDLGCGSGDLAIHLAQIGQRVTGIDFVEAAISQAKHRAGLLPAETAGLLEFRVGDATRPSLLGEKFAAVVDSGFYHLFNPDECEQLINEVASILLPRGRYYLHEFSVEFSIPNVPRKIEADELRGFFRAERGWEILEIQTAEFLSRVAPPVPGICACVQRLA